MERRGLQDYLDVADSQDREVPLEPLELQE